MNYQDFIYRIMLAAWREKRYADAAWHAYQLYAWMENGGDPPAGVPGTAKVLATTVLIDHGPLIGIIAY